MIIDRDIKKYSIFSEDSILQALEKISKNKKGIVFAIGDSGVLEGVITDGDLRRWLAAQASIDLHQPVSLVANVDYNFCFEKESPEKITESFSERIEFVPLVDSHHRLVAVASKKAQIITIDKHEISADSSVFIIAEIGNNHNGSTELAKELIDRAIWAGADCVKFQMRDMETLYKNEGNADDSSEDLGSQYVLDLLSRVQLEQEQLFGLFDYCREKGIVPLCTPWDAVSVERLDKYGIQAFKVASADITNHDLLTAIAKKNKPMICSTGMSTEREIQASVRLLRIMGAQYVLMHCNSTYPAPYKDIQLNFIKRLREIGNCIVGYSGHERGINVAIAAVAHGAKVIEKHFTLDKTMEGSDHKVSLLPEEFKNMVLGIREVEQAMGIFNRRHVSQGEMINRESLGKSLVINCDLKAGEIITADVIEVRSPGKGVSPYRKKELIGKITRRDFKKNDFFYPADIEDNPVKPRNYHFRRPFGVPVRYHDAMRIAGMTNVDLLEFHLSYKDLEQSIQDFFPDPLPLGFVVHCPELFSNDHILDLCSKKETYRKRSVMEVQRVIGITRELKQYFPNTKKPCIVLNAGGFSMDAFISPSEKGKYYTVLLESLSSLDTEGVEIIPQTMPPFPWHFGGQRYHNLFVDPDELVNFCGDNKFRICLDVSHSKLACNYYKWSFSKFINKAAPFTAHIHMGDASGVDGEGLQIGEGDIDFAMVAEVLDRTSPSASFIPEVWQGHKNDGAGFWQALERLEAWF